jgi:NADPH-dependent curcumin reductase CurA
MNARDPDWEARMKDDPVNNYAVPMELGDVMVGESVARVIQSNTPAYAVGDLVTCYSGWQEYHVFPGDQPRVHKLNPKGLPPQLFLGVAGMPGRTAYGGLMYVGKPRAGETLVVAAAAGPVGSVVGQLAKQMGCRVVGIAGGARKCAYVVDILGFDECLDYKAPGLPERLAQACPNGIDIYFENVGGDVSRAVAPLLNPHARVPICGYVSSYNQAQGSESDTPFQIFGALNPPPEHRFFLVHEWEDQYEQITAILQEKLSAGQIKYEETVAYGIESSINAFKEMLKGRNLGKQLIKMR